MSFKIIKEFENQISQFYGSPYAVAVDSCTHAIELCLRYQKIKKIVIPKRTYLSIAFLANKIGIDLELKDENWVDNYYIGGTNIIDAAVLWRRDSYIFETLMCLSFQYQKHLSLGRGGMILTDNIKTRDDLKRMSYDGRISDIPWRDQNIKSIGYHYYMTPETAQLGLDKLPDAIKTKPRKWSIEDWPNLQKMDVFK